MTTRMNHQLKNKHSIEHHCNLSFITVIEDKRPRISSRRLP